jgi:hypothetical protein
MKLRKVAIIYSAVFTALAVWLILTLSNPSDQVTPRPTPIVGRGPVAPPPTNNHTFSNVNSFGKSQGGSARVYPLLEPLAPFSQTVNGYTVTLYLLYADANRVVLTYTVQSAFQDLTTISACDPLVGQDQPCYVSGVTIYGPGGVIVATPPPTPTPRPYYEPKLTADNGRTLPWSRDMAWHAEDQFSTRLVFDTQLPPEALPAQLKLHLAMDIAQFYFLNSHTGGLYSRDIKGPFAFDFTLPLDPERSILELNQTATTSVGDKITIEKVIATRNNVRVRWRLEKPSQPQPTIGAGITDRGLYACCSLKLEAGGKFVNFPYIYPYFYPYLSPYGPLPELETIADASLMDERGEWTISVSYFSTYMGNAYFPPVPGPTFHFTMPPPIR